MAQATRKTTRKKEPASPIVVSREDFFADPMKYALKASTVRRVIVKNADGSTYMVMGGSLDHPVAF